MKKFLCLLLVMVTCFSVNTFAATDFKDIKNEKHKAAVEKLVLFNIINGYEDGTFKPDNKVTRAELSKMLVVAMGKQSLVEPAKSKYLAFSDVLSSYWAYGHIKVASDEKLVNGYEDGTFKPAGNVTYAEAATMVLRALGYEDEVKRSELKWPNNYMSCADDLELFEGISTFKAGDPANRGDIAILLWNALRTGTAEIVAYNDKGVIYDEGTPMITEYLGYTYIEEATISKVEFSDDLREAEVTFKQEGKKDKKLEFKAEDALDMFGRTISILYDPMNGEILELVAEGDLKSVDAQVTNVSETKIYVANRKNGYKLPESDKILLYGINKMSDAAEAILILDDTSLEYLVLMGASDVNVGMVVDADYLIDDDYGIRVREPDQTKGGTGYLVAGEGNWPTTGAVILYYFDADDLLVPIRTLDKSKAVTVSTIDDDYIETSDGKKYEFEDEDSYSMYTLKSSRLETATLASIDKKMDKLVILDYNRHYYLFNIENAIIENLDPEIENALYDLEDWLEEAEEYDEEDFSQASFTDLVEAIEYANATDYTSTLTRINRAISKLEEAIKYLEDPANKTEEATVKAKKALRKLVNGEAKKVYDDEVLYTYDSYDVFDEAYDYARELIKTDDATEKEIKDAERELYLAIDALEKKD
ncbi:MAG: S-layer homology domain-containing protein [Clostridia bacterium]|nr:S-layer homology domain-containing protein [Clostridia bacterium]